MSIWRRLGTTFGANVGVGDAVDLCDLAIREAELLEIVQTLLPRPRGAVDRRDLVDLLDEEPVHLRQLAHTLDGHAFDQSSHDGVHARGRRVTQGALEIAPVLPAGSGAEGAGVEHAERLLQDLGEATPDGHHLADRLHLGPDASVGAPELLQVPARHLARDVVEGRLEERGRRPGDVVLQLVQAGAETELGRDVGEGIAGGLGREGARARQAGVDLDDAIIPALRVERELDVALADDPQVADGLERDRPQRLDLAVGQRLHRRDDDGITRVDAERVDVLHGADADALVGAIAHDLELELLAPREALFDEHLGDARAEDALQRRPQVLFPLDDGRAAPAEREGAAQDHGQPDAVGRLDGVFQRRCGLASRHLDADLGEPLVEQLPVLGVADGLDRRSEHLHAAAGQCAPCLQRKAAVERRLPTERQQDRVDLLGLDDPLDHVRVEGERVQLVAEPLGRLNRGDVRVDEHGVEARFAQGLQSLRARVVELAGLADLERTGSEQKDATRSVHGRTPGLA